MDNTNQETEVTEIAKFTFDLDKLYQAVVPTEVTEIFSTREIEDYREIFKLYDNDLKGKLSLSTIPDIFKRINHTFDENILEKAVEYVDPEKTGEVDIAGFLIIAVRTFTFELKQEEIVKAFNVYHPRSHIIALPDLSFFMKQFGDPLDESEVDVLLQLASDEPEGEADYELLVERIAKQLEEYQDDVLAFFELKEEELPVESEPSLFEMSKSLEDMLKSIQTMSHGTEDVFKDGDDVLNNSDFERQSLEGSLSLLSSSDEEISNEEGNFSTVDREISYSEKELSSIDEEISNFEKELSSIDNETDEISNVEGEEFEGEDFIQEAESE